jgi:hypothetical protein
MVERLWRLLYAGGLPTGNRRIHVAEMLVTKQLSASRQLCLEKLIRFLFRIDRSMQQAAVLMGSEGKQNGGRYSSCLPLAPQTLFNSSAIELHLALQEGAPGNGVIPLLHPSCVSAFNRSIAAGTCKAEIRVFKKAVLYAGVLAAGLRTPRL